MRYFTIPYLFFLCFNTSFATPMNGMLQTFDIKKANMQFDKINLQLSVHNLNLSNLDGAVNTLTKLTTKAEKCVDDVQKKIINVETMIKQDSNPIDKSSQGADLVYLNTQQKELADEQAQCRLFTIRAKEAIDAYKIAIAQLKQTEALTRGMPLWKTINLSLDAAEIKFMDLFTIQLSSALPSLVHGLLWILLAATGSILLLKHFNKSRFARAHLKFKQVSLSHIILLTLFFSSGALFVDLLMLSKELSISSLLLALSELVFFYLLAVISLLFIFKLKSIRSLFYWYSLDATFFQLFAIVVLSFYASAFIEQLFSISVNTNGPLWQLCQSLFLLLILITGSYFIYRFCKHHHFHWIRNHFKMIQTFSALFLITCATINILGYHTLAQHLIFSGFSTFTNLFITVLITQGIQKLYLLLSQNPNLKSRMMTYFGYKKDEVFTEFLILKTIAQLLVWSISIYWIGQSWGFATDLIEIIYDQLLHGVHLANVTIYPTRIISGMIVFCLLYLLSCAISTAISRHQQFENEEETQVAVASILTYVGFTLALITGLLVAGFDFTGLAIIAGALSVGIGLGLQSIVNNFVSGLILLIEKPIRPGDRINVDGVEGFVKKIRVRSTQIITPSREDIIVPNSDLITHRVTNYMFSDKFCRIDCEVGVAYGSDTQKVHDVLMEVALLHEEVVKSNRHKPVVLFRSFGNSALMFQLSCLIKDVNKKSLVRSDLHYAIDKAFRLHNLIMPFPQSEIHLNLKTPDP